MLGHIYSTGVFHDECHMKIVIYLYYRPLILRYHDIQHNDILFGTNFGDIECMKMKEMKPRGILGFNRTLSV
jgi:hypothetical protein